ncbi:unnamed protein product, partial [Meganyctiphanes norvegica]
QIQPPSGLSLIRLSLYDADDSHCQDIAILVQQCFGPRTQGKLWLHDSNITGAGAITLLRCLGEERVKCSSINIWSSHALSHEQEEEMKKLAEDCVKQKIGWFCGE